MFQCVKAIKNNLEIIAVSVSTILAYLFNEVANVISALILIGCGISLFFYCYHKEKNLFSFSGLMCAGFLCPMGLALFRLSGYQITWQNNTWLCFWLAPSCFLFGRKYAPSLLAWVDQHLHGRVLIERPERRPRLLFVSGICVFAVAMATMLIKWHAAGFLPLFAGRYTAYVEYLTSEGYSAPASLSSIFLLSTLYNLFLANAWLLYPLWLVPSIMVIYCLKVKLPMRVVCGSICLIGILITMVVLSRDLYIKTMVCLTVTTYFCMNRGKLIAVLILLTATLAGFYMMTNARITTNESLNRAFEINQESTSRKSKTESRLKITRESAEGGKASAERGKASAERGSTNDSRAGVTVVNKNLPSIVVWIYGYFTCGYDNFDYLVEINDHLYYGLAQLRSLFIVLRMKDRHNDAMGAIAKTNDYNVIPTITVHTFLKEPYLDFGIPGVALSMFFWGLIFGAVESFYLRFKGKLSLLCYAAFAHHLIFICLVNWMLHTSYLFSIALLCVLFFLIYDFGKNKTWDT